MYGSTEACRTGDIEKVKKLLRENRSKININDQYEAAFQVACYKGQENIVRMLLEQGEMKGHRKININARNEAAFRYAYVKNHKKIVMLLLKQGEKKGYNKININAQDDHVFRWACSNNDEKFIRLLFKYEEKKGYNKIDIHVDNKASFRSACYNSYENIVKLLIEHGVDYTTEHHEILLRPAIIDTIVRHRHDHHLIKNTDLKKRVDEKISQTKEVIKNSTNMCSDVIRLIMNYAGYL